MQKIGQIKFFLCMHIKQLYGKRMHLEKERISRQIVCEAHGRFYIQESYLYPDRASPRERRKLVLIAVSPFRIKFKSKEGEVISKDEVLFRSIPAHGYVFFSSRFLRHLYRLLACWLSNIAISGRYLIIEKKYWFAFHVDTVAHFRR